MPRRRETAARLGLAPEGARAAARFGHDQATQNYVELEGGGKPAFAALVAGDVYAPYWWEVRLFQPGEVAEATVRFRPDGTPLGFSRTLAETFVPPEKDGLALDPETARKLAEKVARDEWKRRFLRASPAGRDTGDAHNGSRRPQLRVRAHERQHRRLVVPAAA